MLWLRQWIDSPGSRIWETTKWNELKRSNVIKGEKGRRSFRCLERKFFSSCRFYWNKTWQISRLTHNFVIHFNICVMWFFFLDVYRLFVFITFLKNIFLYRNFERRELLSYILCLQKCVVGKRRLLSNVFLSSSFTQCFYLREPWFN